ncbi:EAL domain-containing protein [Paucibacter sp. PLA-PC-4]|uniref:putative bifunctional diguanylate cyclase/phosphodiesterase n=1 Tax=Paucibacter sp. PLA-PC-4 TaxID=2993655 RepID=UPI00224AD5EF|nr:EAL domain-containing protein [Paucibacter sp. PLA-PC-4]MCX2865252.1 EAL domain-containing protein [Paucibacter sp. PLA-PC-4]
MSRTEVAMNLEERNRQYAALDLVTEPVWIFDIDCRRIHWANRAALAVWSAPDLSELCGRDMGTGMSESVARRLAQYQSDFESCGASFNEQWTHYPGGKPVALNVRFSGHRLPDHRMAMFCEGRVSGLIEPESLRSVEALLHTAVMISLFSADGQALYRNPAARDSVRSPTETLKDRIVDGTAYAALVRALDEAGSVTRTLQVSTANGERWHEVSGRRCTDAVTGQSALLISEADVSAIKRTEAQARFLSMHDSLTGLANRTHLMQRFESIVASMRAVGEQAALIFIDLDQFKDVNDTLGHAAGDLLLVETAQRLRRLVRSEDLVARLGGDEFLILMVGENVRYELERIKTRLMLSVSEPMMIDNHEVRVTPSIGVSFFPDDGHDVQTLLRNADLAMYTAKARGRNEVAYYDPVMTEAVKNRTALEADLRHALDRGEFVVFYQPIVDVATGVIVGAEALVRWRHPERGFVSPDVFIPTCESTGMVHDLGRFVFRTAVAQQVAWRVAGHNLRVSVNLSPRQLLHAELLADLTQALGDAQGDACQMQVEITESMLVGRGETALELLHEIQALGIGIALDDFGTGYSNLGYLQRYPIGTLKIDKSFVQCAEANRPLAEMIVAMCRLMRLKVVAEGVETEEQLAWVRQHGIEFCQGYLFAKPLPADEFAALLR